MRRGRWVLAIVAIALLVGAAGVAVTAQETSSTSESDLTLSELREDGTRYTGSPDSVRIEDDQMFWLIHWPAGISGSPGDPDDNQWQYLSPDDVVDRNSVWLRTINTGDR